MLTNMVEIRNTGRAALRDVRQFGRAGIPIYEALNTVLGTSGEELGEMITKRKIGLKEITMALKHLTGAGGKFHNLMQDQMGTLIGQFSNLGDAFEIMAEKIGQPLLKPIKAIVESTSPP
jgi:phage tail tape-measure protein